MKRFREQLIMEWAQGPEPPPEPQLPEAYRLRQWRDGDESAFAQVMRSSGFKDWNEQTVRAEALRGGLGSDGVLVIDCNGRIVATGCLLGERPGTATANPPALSWIAVDAAHRGKKLGSAISVGLLRKAVDFGYARVRLLTDEWRLPAIASYLDLGFKPVEDNRSRAARWRLVKRILFQSDYPIRTVRRKGRKKLLHQLVSLEYHFPVDFFPVSYRRNKLLERLLGFSDSGD